LPDEDDEAVGMLQVHNETRWNSVLSEFSSTLRDRNAVDQFAFSNRYNDSCRVPAEYTFDPEDWQALAVCREILEPFRSHTVFHEGNNVLLPTVKASSIELQAYLQACLARFGAAAASEVRTFPKLFSYSY
jgi:hypothetical protein